MSAADPPLGVVAPDTAATEVCRRYDAAPGADHHDPNLAGAQSSESLGRIRAEQRACPAAPGSADAQAALVSEILDEQADRLLEDASTTTRLADETRARATQLDAHAQDLHRRADRLHQRAEQLRDEMQQAKT